MRAAVQRSPRLDSEAPAALGRALAILALTTLAACGRRVTALDLAPQRQQQVCVHADTIRMEIKGLEPRGGWQQTVGVRTDTIPCP